MSDDSENHDLQCLSNSSSTAVYEILQRFGQLSLKNSS